ncbi:MAG: hypothetical protein A3F31_04070 [Candidatus Levybacteria bacterium RIFCSPHIGHO2_12_FULL_38_12]|nr:MAG: hypothetical protein A3F31_04070 [Candidatus Levybacteria bacterium RIFCSPHIGHO2_12_FULL_38_12]OGH44441.1 MAG: hypothetical protein A3J14_03245 [Candidatus Levybacteria bacterium RIFCSPLOWO2_02_FULL_37_18]
MIDMYISMSFYEIITFITLINLPFFPQQDSIWVRYIVFAYAVYLLPLALRRLVTASGAKQSHEIASSQAPRNDRIIKIFLIFLTVSFISTIFSTNLQTSYVQLLLFFSYFVIYVTSGSVFNTLQKKERLAGVLIFVTVVLSTISLYNTLILHYSSKLSRGVSFMWIYFGHNHLSALLIFAIPLCLFVLKTNWDKLGYRIIFSLIFIFLLYSLILTSAQASLISLSIMSYLFFLGYSYRSRQKINFIFVFWILVVAIVVWSILSRQGMVQLESAIYDLNISARLMYIKSAVESARLVPFAGTGLDTYKLINFNSGLGLAKTFYVHNFFFQMLSDTGIFGFVMSIMLIISALWEGGKRVFEQLEANERFFFLMLWLSLLSSALNALVDFDWQLPTVFFIFWLLTGLI